MAETEALSSRLRRRRRKGRRDRKGSGPSDARVVAALEALNRGEFAHRLRGRDGISRPVQEAFDELAERLDRTAIELARVTSVVGRNGEVDERLSTGDLHGGWRSIADSYNSVIDNLVRASMEVARVIVHVAHGDLSQKVALESDGKPVRGELARIGMSVNRMVDQLRALASEVARIAREVGIEGKLGGQARVPGAEGSWLHVVDNTNQLADNLTKQIRAIADVAASITEGDLSRSITVEARGEVAQLKERVNQMIANLRETTQKNREQDWLKSNLARFGSLMQGQKSVEAVGRLIMSELPPLVQASHGAFFVLEEVDGVGSLALMATYAYCPRGNVSTRFALGEGIVGQAALEKKSIVLSQVPSDYIEVRSGLGEAPPRSIIVIPILFEGEVRAVVELAGFEPLRRIHRVFLEQLSETIGVVLNMIGASSRKEELLAQSQTLAHELRAQSRELQQQQDQLRRSNRDLEQQARTLRASEEMMRQQREELQRANEELEEKASLLVERNRVVEQKNLEVELARRAVEEKAAQLALTSKYKSQFLANMSHELRTPLNSLLILARMLSENKDGNLNSRQVEYARTIHGSGTDLLALINEVLDLSKVEAGKIELYPTEVGVGDVLKQVEQTFRPVAAQKKLAFVIDVDRDVPSNVTTDGQRLVQILRNLLGNAFKFTDQGSVHLRVSLPDAGTQFASASLARDAGRVVAFSVIDSGIGIPKEKQRLIFEAFQQVDGTTSRRHGGTGLGLSISRELAHLLGGELTVESEIGKGSTLTLYIPFAHEPCDAGRRSAAWSKASTLLPAREGGDESGAGTATDHLRGKRVLVVDDDVRNIYALSAVLEDAGMSVVFAENGKAGIEALESKGGIDVVLMDITMPELDGYATMRRIRQMPELESLPVLALTANAMKGDREKCLASGASDYVTKPVDPDQLLALIRLCLSSRAGEDRQPGAPHDDSQGSVAGRFTDGSRSATHERGS